MPVDLSHVFDARRWRSRFRGERTVLDEAKASGSAPDATVDEVGQAPPKEGFDGHPLRDDRGTGHGTGDPGGPGWAGWGGV